jgi:pimeloyl-ACP methyl ester carboxylesterase
MRFDYDGTGDSAGDQWDDQRVASWRAGLAHAVNEMRALGVERINVIGLRFGATLALLDAHAVHADSVVAWLPAESGRRYVKELRLLGMPVPPSASGSADGSIVVAGFVVPGAALSELGTLDVAALDAAPAPRLLMVERPDRPPSDATVAHLEVLGVQVDRLVEPGSELALDLPTEYATVPTDLVDGIAKWVGDVPEHTPRPLPDGRTVGDLEGSLERVVKLGPNELVGIMGEPTISPPHARPATVVFLNTGSEPHIGPGRAWVEYSRALNAVGHTTVRVDFRGWGESPDDGFAPGRPYDPHTVDDTIAVVEQLAAEGHERIVLVGLCASAWVALTAARRASVAGVIALNPQLYFRQGDPVEATLPETRKRRTKEREREELGGRLGLWTVLDVLGIRHAAAKRLRELVRRGKPMLFLFADGDDGIEFLHNRMRRTLSQVKRSGVIEVVEMPEIDHPMHRHWLRTMIVEQMTNFVDRLDEATRK